MTTTIPPAAKSLPRPTFPVPQGPDSPPIKPQAQPTRTASGEPTSTGEDQFDFGTHTGHVLSRGPILRSPMLGLAADVVDDLERVRNANANRLRQMTRPESQLDADGQRRGFGLPSDHPDVERLSVLVENMSDLYDDAVKNLEKMMKVHPLGAWQRKTVGVGAKRLARLLAAIGDPYWNDLHERPRTVSELWAFCGYHVLPVGQDSDAHGEIANGAKLHAGGHALNEAHSQLAPGVAPSRRRGQKANWSSSAKMRAYLISESCVIARTSPYRVVYDDARAKYAEGTHHWPCVRCGPSGKPAQPGSPLSLGHQHARGLRAISKAVLKDLWIESKRLHELS